MNSIGAIERSDQQSSEEMRGGTLAVFTLAWLLGKAMPASTPALTSEAASE